MTVMHEPQPYAGASADAIEEHYDVSNEFFRLMLGDTRTYSAALWQDGDTLDEAQIRKVDYHIEQAGAAGSGRVLDIGCGWGTMVRRLTETHGVQHAVGLTLSKNQASHIQGMGLDKVDVRVENWHDHQPEEPYDAIISVGAFEHFVRRYLSREERVEGFREFFERCRSWLAPGGRLSLQTMAIGNKWRFDRDMIRDANFFYDTYFKETDLGFFSEIVQASERIFDVVSVRVDADHYSRTCQAWLDNLRANRAEAIAAAGEEVYLAHERAMAAGVRAYAERFTTLLRISFD